VDRGRGGKGDYGLFYDIIIKKYSGARIQESEEMKRPLAKCFEDLIVWQRAHHFVLSIYRMSADFPKNEIYGLTSQLRRAAVSIPANIAEGFKRRTRAEKARFMNISQGSLEECRYYLILIQDLHLADSTELMNQLEEVSKLLDAYASSILASGS
jgi:four helix bundle protein